MGENRGEMPNVFDEASANIRRSIIHGTGKTRVLVLVKDFEVL
jgi:hypothetical protein